MFIHNSYHHKLRRQTRGGGSDYTTFDDDRGRGFGSKRRRQNRAIMSGDKIVNETTFIRCVYYCFIFEILTNMRLRLQGKGVLLN